MKLTMLYEQTDYLSVNLAIQSHDATTLHISVIHEGITATTTRDMTGCETIVLNHIQDKEAVVILARFHSAIVASAVLEVDTACIADGYVLQQRSLYNAMIDQCETTRLERATTKALVIADEAHSVAVDERPDDTVLDTMIADIDALRILTGSGDAL